MSHADACLAAIRECAETGSMRQVVTEDVPRLLAAVESALAAHPRREVPGRPNLYPHCGECGEPWPCRNYKLNSEVISRALQERTPQ